MEAVGDEWRIGAMTRLWEIADPERGARIPLLSRAAAGIGSPEVRNVATIGGNICNASPAADLLAPLLALGARVHLCSADGDRWLEMKDFYKSAHRTAIATGELLTEIGIPRASCESGFGLSKYATAPQMGMTLVLSACVHLPGTGAYRVATAIATGRPIVTEATKPKSLEAVQDLLTESLRDGLASGAAARSSCHYARENRQAPDWYLVRRAQLAAREAIAQAWEGASGGTIS
jgi:CO/xanthine dehydrogenase FAD-binding subunit